MLRRWSETRLPVLLAAVSVSIFFGAILLEGCARLFYAYRYEIAAIQGLVKVSNVAVHLDAYEMASLKAANHWVLRPGYEANLKQIVAAKRRQGKLLSARALEDQRKLLALPSFGVLRVNEQGFKGPDMSKDLSRIRILNIGDSTTFGFGPFDYSSALRRALADQGIEAEIINAGVEGYSTRNVVLELDRYASIKPTVTTIYIGWNDLFSDSGVVNRMHRFFRTPWFFRRGVDALGTLLGYPPEYELLGAEPADPADPDIAISNSYDPPFMDNLETIVNSLRAVGSRVVLLTLPGLFMTDIDISPEALRIGHLPKYTKNPLVLSKAVERYNKALRDFAARHEVAVYDLAEWSKTAFKPRSYFFTDSVHLKATGLSMVGLHLVEKLTPLLRALKKREAE